MDEKIIQTLANLKRNHMTGYFIQQRKDLFSLLKSLVPEGQTVGWGDSLTLEDLGIFDFFRSECYTVYDKHVPELTSEEKRALYIKNFSADTFITGTNAVTTDGLLVNIDGNGSRVAPMIYGPGQVIVIVGKNKIVDDLDSAMERVRQTAAPLDAKRLEKDTPCVKLGKCIDCRHPQRICNDFVVIAGQFNRDRIKVIIVDEVLGL